MKKRAIFQLLTGPCAQLHACEVEMMARLEERIRYDEQMEGLLDQLMKVCG